MPRHYYAALAVPVLLLLGGTVGYRVIEGWSTLDALYMTVITVATVGYREVHPLSTQGRIFTMALILGGAFTLLYAATAIIRAVATGELGAHFGRQRMDRALAALSGHTIVCGYGRMGRLVCREFAALGQPFVIVDQDPAALAEFRDGKGLSLAGDATEDAVLREAGVDRARFLVTVASSDAANLYITMSARLLNEKLFIVARAEDEEAEKKLVRAGANRVVSPYSIGGHRVAQAVLRPNVVDFIELATRSDFMDLQLEEVAVGKDSALAGRSLRDSRVRQDLGVIIVAMKKPDGRMIFNPEGELSMTAGDVLITLGHADQLRRLEELAAPR